MGRLSSYHMRNKLVPNGFILFHPSCNLATVACAVCFVRQLDKGWARLGIHAPTLGSCPPPPALIPPHQLSFQPTSSHSPPVLLDHAHLQPFVLDRTRSGLFDVVTWQWQWRHASSGGPGGAAAAVAAALLTLLLFARPRSRSTSPTSAFTYTCSPFPHLIVLACSCLFSSSILSVLISIQVLVDLLTIFVCFALG